MQCEIIMIGTELLLGQIVDTNAAFMGQTLAENGFSLLRKTTVGDNAARIRDVLDKALDRADVVLTSGGLGPTEDDITRECIAELLDRPLEFHQELLDVLMARFAHIGVRISENNRKQAYLPRGAAAIENPHGTAPGLLVEDPRGVIISMPGVPSELKPMLTDRVIPYLRHRYNVPAVIHSRVLKVCGIGESRVDEALGVLIRESSNPTIGLLAYPDAVRIRITARAASVSEADALIDTMELRVRERLPGLIMGVNDDTIEAVVDGLMVGRGWRLAVAESTTGGMICQRLTAAEAACFAGGMVLPVLRVHTDQPEDAAREMAEQARVHSHAECGLGVVPDESGNRTIVHFVTPIDAMTWSVGRYTGGERHQLRVSIMALENIRRYLTGVPV